MELVTMSATELDRIEVLRRVLERKLTRKKAGALLGMSERQTRRLCKLLQRFGPSALASKKRGMPSNRRLPQLLRDKVLAIVRERYPDFGPKLAHEKLSELHDLRLGRETLRLWMSAAGIWKTRAARKAAPHQPRGRRECYGELVQIDGCDHHWFEDRGPACTLLVYVDDATGRLMELRFVPTESAFDYFDATRSYLERHGKPVAFYSDKHSIFRAHAGRAATATGRAAGITQFGRALSELNIDIICANTPQAKGRVERMNLTLQDRLVKDLRLQGISTRDEANRFAPRFMEDYNRRFGREPLNPHDAHRPLLSSDNLDRIFTWQEERTLSENLVVHFRRRMYLVTPSPKAVRLGGARVRVLEDRAGRVEIRAGELALPYTVVDKNPVVEQGAIVENKHLGAALVATRLLQVERDEKRLSSKSLTLREKASIAKALETALDLSRLPGGEHKERLAPVLDSMRSAMAEADARRREQNRRAQEQFRARRAAALADAAGRESQGRPVGG